MKIKYTILGLVICLFCSSCVEQKILLKRNKVYSVTLAPPPAGGTPIYTLTEHKLDRRQDVFLNDKTQYLTVRFATTPTFDVPSQKQCTSPVDFTYQANLVPLLAASPPQYFFPGDTKGYSCAAGQINVKKLHYLDGKFILQALTIPLKIRPALDGVVYEQVYKDTFSTQVEAGVSIALAAGWKFNYNTYSSKNNILGSRYNRYSFSPGFFLGTSVIDLKKLNTNPDIKFDKKAAAISTGFFAMIGINSINLGLAVGWDAAIGEKNKAWVYNKKPWYGIAVGLDLIK